MLRRTAATSISLLVLLASVTVAGEVDLPRYPGISPDGAWVTFSWRGDLWKVPATGGRAQHLTRHAGMEYRSAWSPDGRQIAFESARDGFLNLYVMDADGSNVRQVTFEDTGCVMSGYEPDGSSLLFQSGRELDVYSNTRPFSVSVDGGPITRVHDAFGRAPRTSPDGTRLSFTRGHSAWSRRHYRGPAARDVWLLDRANGSFRRLTTWAGNDGQARWQDDARLVYLSDRELDTVNLYRMDASGGDASAERLTGFADQDVTHFDIARDTQVAVLHAWDRLYTLDLTQDGAKPRALSITAPEDEGDRTRLQNVSSKVTEAQLSPDGKVLATIAYGEVYVRNVEDKQPTRRVTRSAAREQQIRWSPDGMTLYFVSDRDGTDSIYGATVALTRSEIREQFDEATKPPVPESTVEPEPTTAAPKPKEDEAKKDEPKATEPAATDPKAEDKPSEESEDGEKKPDEGAKDKKDADDDAPGPDRWHDAVRFTVTPVLTESTNDREPVPSPDGKSLAFRRGLGDWMVMDLATRSTRLLVSGWDSGTNLTWSPDSRHIAYDQDDRNFNSDVFIVPADGSAPPVNVSRHPANDFGGSWSADSKVFAFVSERQERREYDVWLVFLDKELEAMTALDRDAYFEQAGKAAKKRKPLAPPKKEEPEKGNDEKDQGEKKKGDGDKAAAAKKDEPRKPLDLADAYLRLRRVTSLPGSEFGALLTPAGDTVVFTGTGKQAGLYTIKWDGTGEKKLGGAAGVQGLSFKGDQVVWVQSGRAGTAPIGGGARKTIAINDTIEVDLAAEAEQKFREAARVLGEGFYHPTMKGLDWPRLTERYQALAARARTQQDFDAVANRFLGELNASHLGIRSPSPSMPNSRPNGRLGVRGERTQDGFRIDSVIPYGPAAEGSMRLLPGDVITGIELAPLAPTDTLLSRLKGRVGEETILDVRRKQGDAETPLDLRVLVTPVSSRVLRNLIYDAWQYDNAAKVSEWSNGRLGYIHIRSMSGGPLRDFERDLYAAADGKDGVILDVRNNGGGSTADLLLASISVTPHAYTVPRGADPSMTTGYPQDRLFIQRYVQPMNLLCNEKSFSNAEIFSHAFKTLDRGTLVGEQTYGGVISTGMRRLLDGTTVRMPFRGWYLPDGTDMENNGAIPDLRVPQTAEDEASDTDTQLRTAVDDLLKRLPR